MTDRIRVTVEADPDQADAFTEAAAAAAALGAALARFENAVDRLRAMPTATRPSGAAP